MSVLSRTVTSTNCIAEITFDDRAFTVTLDVRGKTGAAKPVSKVHRCASREAARLLYAGLIAKVQRDGAAFNLKLAPASHGRPAGNVAAL